MFGWFERAERQGERRPVGLRLEAMEVRDVPARLAGGVDDHPKLDKPEHGPEIQIRVLDDRGGVRGGKQVDDPAGHNANDTARPRGPGADAPAGRNTNDSRGGGGHQTDDPAGHR